MSYAAFQCFTADFASCNRMHMSHLFFFSYARATLKYASGYNHQTGDRYNLLELLYEELVQLVHQAEGGDASDIGYFDQIDLAIGDPWPERLATAAATSKVLVAIITPSYLQSSNCGCEFRAFLGSIREINSGKPWPQTRGSDHTTLLRGSSA